MQKLSEYAKQQNISYITAYRAFQKGEIPNSRQLETGSIVIDNTPIFDPKNNVSLAKMEPKSVGIQSDDFKKHNSSLANTRSNRSAYIDPIGRFANIDQVYLPFRYSPYVNNNSNLNVRDVLTLCLKAYFGYPIVRNTIDVCSFFSSSKIYLTGGNKKSRDFFNAYFSKINLESFTLQFFKEFWRSGNCFIMRQMGKIKESDLLKITQSFGEESKAANSLTLPLKYSILNPIDIEARGASSFLSMGYIKILTDYEIQRLRTPQNDEDKAIFNNLDKATQDLIIKGNNNPIYVTLTPDIVTAIFNGKMDYEAFAVPMTYGVLDSLEAKTQLMKMDMAIARTCQQAVLLITHGYLGKDDSYNYSQTVTDALESIFANQSVGRVLICDFTTKAEFVIPQIGDILDPKKYEIIEKDLENGLGYSLFGAGGGGEKFANQQGKIEIFIEKLRSARTVFLNEFLINEIKNISRQLGFKNYPIPHFEDIDLKDSNEFKRIVTQLTTLGLLTPEETFEALNTQKFPTQEDSLQNQAEYRKQRDAGLYEPVQGGPYSTLNLAKETAALAPKTDPAATSKPNITPSGRPPGTKAPQTTKKVGKIGSNSNFSLTKVKDNLIKAAELQEKLSAKLRKKHKIKGDFNDSQKLFLEELTNNIVANEKQENWKDVDKFIDNPPELTAENKEKLEEICQEHQVNYFIGGILMNSIV